MKNIFKFLTGNGLTYTIKRGDSLGRIAAKYGMTITQLLKLNPEIKNPDQIKEGLIINITKPKLTPTTQDYAAHRGNGTFLMNYKPRQFQLPQQDFYITNENYLERLKHFQKVFEKFSPTVTSTKNTSNDEYTDVLGYGMSFYLDENGTKREFKPNERITKEDAEIQLDRWYKFILPKLISGLGIKNWEYYDPEVKFTLADALFNGGPGMLSTDKSPKYRTALAAYDSSFKNGVSDYNISDLQQHADWNRTKVINEKTGQRGDNGFIGIRSLIRLFPNKISWDLVNDNLYSIPVENIPAIKDEYRKIVGLPPQGFKFGGKLHLIPKN